MPLVLDGTNGVSGVDGTASNPAIEGTDSNTGIFYPAADTVAIGTGGTERLRVDSAGNVGIATTTPTAALDILGGIRLNKNGNLTTAKVGNFGVTNFEGYITPYSENGITEIHNTTSSGRISFFTGNSDTERARITSGGNLLVGTTTSVSRLTIAENAYDASISLISAAEPTRYGAQIQSTTPAGVTNLLFLINSNNSGYVERARITGNGDFCVGATSAPTNTGVIFEQGKYFTVASNVGPGAPKNPGINYGINIGWNRSNGDGESNIIWGTGSGGNPALTFASWNGTTYAERARITSSGNFKVNNGAYLEGNDYVIYLRSLQLNGDYGYTEKFFNSALGVGGDPSRHYIRLCNAYNTGGAISKSYFIGQVMFSRGGVAAGNISSAVQVYVAGAYLSNSTGGVNFGDTTIEIVRFTAGGVVWLGVRFNANVSACGVNVIGVVAASADPAIIADGSVSNVTVLKTLPTAT